MIGVEAKFYNLQFTNESHQENQENYQPTWWHGL
jgi:hypothetical protein